ncbi:hypothetical protein JZO66_05570 [Enterococcus sp. DIV0242_7C1]|uniref:DUF4179 domain-containing protein n=1 Tax=Candidatus Enterococcus dunnyi TaxID=1834192 RepID=A0A200IZN4_9ENTE|nr:MULTISPECIES: hypothetical protein [unclassified Enterococcus]MBO0470003.1 hypothetical protein [Enterococcus sp. DIV0242_7C1]OUZ30446.1 hypothetical protein A5889_002734 [Enterococcus sp. 9D6_DIV0238]
MDKKIIDTLKNEKEIPKEVMEKLTYSRTAILNNKIKQDKKIKISYMYKIIISIALAALALLFIITKTPVGAAIEQAFGISKDSGVEIVENNQIPTQLDLTSVSNGREIKLTKFVSTKKKYAFDYQFELNDEKLRALLEKDIAVGNSMQFIDFGLFAEGSSEDLFGGVTQYPTFRIEGNMFYGSVVSTFTREKIPDDAKLTLVINRLWWQDNDDFMAAQAAAFADPVHPQPFSVDTALEYEGDWRFEIEYKPLTQTAKTNITNINNITDIRVKNDALQTSVKFIAPLNEQSNPSVTLFKNGVKSENQVDQMIYDLEKGEINISFDFSALDTTSVYTIQLNEADDFTGEALEEIGRFDLQNEAGPPK